MGIAGARALSGARVGLLKPRASAMRGGRCRFSFRGLGGAADLRRAIAGGPALGGLGIEAWTDQKTKQNTKRC